MRNWEILMLGYKKESFQGTLGKKSVQGYNKRLHRIVDSIDVKVDEELPINSKQIQFINPFDNPIIEEDEEHVEDVEEEKTQDEIEFEVQHSMKMFRDFEEEISLLEEWLKMDTCSEDYIQFVDLANLEEQLRVPYNSGINEYEMQ